MARSLQEKDRHYLWHPFTQMKDYAARDLPLIERAEGLLLFDAEGRSYYDTISSWWCILHGHGHPTIRAAVHRQLDRLEHVLLAGFTHRPAIELAEQLVQIAPAGLSKVYYSDNGSTACEVAIKMSLQYWLQSGHPERNRFVALERGYHGDTIGTMSLGGNIVPVENLADTLQVAFDAGAKRILLPMASVSDIPSIPGELFAKFQTSFYADPSDAVFKALGVE